MKKIRLYEKKTVELSIFSHNDIEEKNVQYNAMDNTFSWLQSL